MCLLIQSSANNTHLTVLCFIVFVGLFVRFAILSIVFFIFIENFKFEWKYFSVYFYYCIVVRASVCLCALMTVSVSFIPKVFVILLNFYPPKKRRLYWFSFQMTMLLLSLILIFFFFCLLKSCC